MADMATALLRRNDNWNDKMIVNYLIECGIPCIEGETDWCRHS